MLVEVSLGELLVELPLVEVSLVEVALVEVSLVEVPLGEVPLGEALVEEVLVEVLVEVLLGESLVEELLVELPLVVEVRLPRPGPHLWLETFRCMTKLRGWLWRKHKGRVPPLTLGYKSV